MGTRISLGLNLALAAVLAWVLLGQIPATGAGGQKWANYAAVAFTDRDTSEHDGDCDPPVDKMGTYEGGEFKGQLDNGKGTYIENVNLPNGAKVNRLSLFGADFDMDNDIHLYLIRKKGIDGLSPKTGAYKTMAEAHSSGAVDDTMRKFSDDTIESRTIDNEQYFYFLELVVCPVTEPYLARIRYTT